MKKPAKPPRSENAAHANGNGNGRASRFGLDQDLELHDANHVEVKRDYPVSWDGGPGSYVVETYIFLPYSFGITPDTFPADQLFALTQSYLRWKDDDFTYEEFTDRGSERSHLARLERGLKAAFAKPGSTLALAHEARSVGCAGRVFLKGEAARCVRAIQGLELARARNGQPDPEAATRVRDEVGRYLDRAGALLERVRAARGLAQQGSELLHSDVVQATRLVDEYLSSIYDQVLAQLYLTVKPAVSLQDGLGGRAALAFRIKDVARRESVHRARSGFCSLDVDLVEQRELYAFKLSLLKKYVSKPLYLEAKAKRTKPAVQHVVGALAAALAAIWAVWVQIYIFANMSPPSGNGPYPSDPTGRTAISAVTSALFVGAVLAYVLKDRLKALVNESFMKRLRPRLPDRDVFLSEHGLGTEARAIGRIREQARFVAADKVPEDVMLVRSHGHTVDVGEERLEVVLLHRRSVELEAAFVHSPGRAVRDILRLNVAPFLERLADPDQSVHHFDARTDAFVHRTAPRVYHLNLVFRLASLEEEKGPVRYERIRVILSQRGILRVEEAVPLGTLDEVRSRRLLDAQVAGGILDLAL
jgi:hypothetical protein